MQLEFQLDDGGEGFMVPVLVASNEMTEVILGYNVIEHLILNGTSQQRTALPSAFQGKENGRRGLVVALMYRLRTCLSYGVLVLVQAT